MPATADGRRRWLRAVVTALGSVVLCAGTAARGELLHVRQDVTGLD